MNKSRVVQSKGFRSICNLRKFSKLFSGEILENIIKADAAAFDLHIKAYVNAHNSSKGKGVAKIDDVMDFMIYILSRNAYKRVFGAELLNQPKVVDIISELSSVESFDHPSLLNIYKFPWNFLRKKISDTNTKKLAEILCSELKNKTNTKSGSRDISLVQLIKQRPEIIDGSDNLSVTLAILHIFKAMVVIPPPKLSNIITDISINPDALNILSTEQACIIKVFGKKLSVSILSEMKILEKFIIKSLLKSSSASYMHRKTKTEIVLSDGITLEKGSIVSINMFSKYHSTGKSKRKSNYNRSTSSKSIETTSKDNKNFKLLWGFGDRSCPFTEYSLLQIKIIIVILIRRYKIFAHAHGTEQQHPGYQKTSHTVPKSSTVFLKKKMAF